MCQSIWNSPLALRYLLQSASAVTTNVTWVARTWVAQTWDDGLLKMGPNQVGSASWKTRSSHDEICCARIRRRSCCPREKLKLTRHVAGSEHDQMRPIWNGRHVGAGAIGPEFPDSLLSKGMVDDEACAMERHALDGAACLRLWARLAKRCSLERLMYDSSSPLLVTRQESRDSRRCS